jgi:glycosyltransferase involved in cell wall biosynthesis
VPGRSLDPPADGTARVLRVLRISKSGVVTAWRERERQLRRRGVDLTLVAAARWEEGGSMVSFTPAGDDFVTPVRTLGRHPNLFVYDPLPLWRLLGSGHWDLIDMHEEPFGLAVAEIMFLARLRSVRAPFVFSSAQNIDKRYPPPFRWFERWSVTRAAGAYGCNTEAGRILRRKGLVGPYEYLPLGVDVERFEPVDRPPPSGTLRVGFVGRLIRHKGVDVLLDAVAPDPRLTVEIFGAGPEHDALVAQADRLGIGHRVSFHGHVGGDDVPGVYRRIDVLAVPSIPLPSWIEQFGRVVAEAQASGVPVVASASGSLPDVVGDDGLLVPPGDPGALGAALARFLDEPGLWDRLRAAGIAGAERYSWGTVADDQVALYRAVTDQPVPGRPPPGR